MRRKIVAANWKMNMSTEDGIDFFQQLRQLPWPKDVEAIVAPPSLYLQKLFEVKGHAQLSGQNCHSEQQGAVQPLCKSVLFELNSLDPSILE